MKILGMDEAGRGCVLGALFVGACCCTEEQLDAILQSGATDSKKLSATKRKKILQTLDQIAQCRYSSISAVEIDAGNINTLEERAFVEHILYFEPDVVYIDAPTHPRGIPAVQQRLVQAIQQADKPVPQFIIEPKADLNYPIVGAASIIAKVHRDASIEKLGSVGSGYPSDPKTRAWIKGFFERGEDLPKSVRTRWGTIENLKKEARS